MNTRINEDYYVSQIVDYAQRTRLNATMGDAGILKDIADYARKQYQLQGPDNLLQGKAFMDFFRQTEHWFKYYPNLQDRNCS